MFWNTDVVDNLVADAYFTVAAFAAFAFLMLRLRWVQRRRINDFLGVESHQTKISAHVSYLVPGHFEVEALLDAPPGADLSKAGGRRSNSFTGPFITKDEVEAFATLRSLVEGQVTDGPDSLRATLQRRTRVRQLSVRLRTEPLPDQSVIARDGLTILLGTGKYNQRSRELLESSASFFRFEFDDRAEYGQSRTFYVNAERTGEFRDYVRENGRHPDPVLSSELAVIQRIHQADSSSRVSSTVLMCCGLSAPATHAAVKYLVQNWRTLAAQYPVAKKMDFGVLLRLPDQDRHSELDRNGRVQLVRIVDGEPIPLNRVRKVRLPVGTPPTGSPVVQMPDAGPSGVDVTESESKEEQDR